MSFKDHGFLGAEAEQFVKTHRAQFKEHFSFVFRMNQIAHNILALAQAKQQLDDTVVVSLYLRALSSFAATIKLMEFGLGIEAGSSLRNLIETTIYLRKCIVDTKWIERYVLASERKRLNLVNDMIKNISDLYDFMQDDLDKLLATRDEIAKSLDGSTIEAEFKIGNLAAEDAVGLERLYKLSFRYFANNATHSTASSIQQYLGTSESGEVTSIKYGPLVEEFPHIFYVVTVAMLSAIHSFGDNVRKRASPNGLPIGPRALII